MIFNKHKGADNFILTVTIPETKKEGHILEGQHNFPSKLDKANTGKEKFRPVSTMNINIKIPKQNIASPQIVYVKKKCLK